MNLTSELNQLLQHKEKYPAVLLFGPPGCGKGTLGKSLALLTGHKHLSSGDMFRGLPSYSRLGQLCQSYSNQGLLIPDEGVVTIWRHYVSGLMATNQYFPQKQHLLLDGLPRTVEQVALLRSDLNVKAIILLDIQSNEELIQRIQKRAQIEKRQDDMSLETLNTRLELYQNETKQILNCYPANLIVKINASQKPLYVVRDVLSALGDVLTIA